MTHGFSGSLTTFTIDTVDTNLAEYFYAHGYDVWLLDFRTSIAIPGSKNAQYSMDAAAKYDYPAAIGLILQETQAEGVDVLAHCMGSTVLFMSLMSGLKGVRSVVSAQIAAHFHPAWEVKWKSVLHVPQILHAFGVRYLTAYAEVHENLANRIYDFILKFYAIPVAGYCNSPSCHRLTFMFAPICEHGQLNKATHDAVVEMFGHANMRTYEQLTKMIRRGSLVNEYGENVYMPHIGDLKMPITFIHGEKSQLFKVQSTFDTLKALYEANPHGDYHHFVMRGHGHNDCMYGKNAFRDVYPTILKHFEKINSGCNLTTGYQMLLEY
jgi:cholesterol oxidase